MRRWIAGLAAMLLLAAGVACGEDDEPAGQATTPTQNTAVPTAEDVRAEAAAAYLAAVEPSNATRRDLQRQMTAAADAGDMREAAAHAGAYAQDAQRLVDELIDLDVPATAQPALDAFVRSQQRIATAMGRFAAAAGEDGANPFTLQDMAGSVRDALDDAGASARVLRARLGLPPPD